MPNLRHVAIVMRNHLQASSRRVGAAYELGQLGNIASNSVNSTSQKPSTNETSYSGVKSSGVNYHYLTRPWESRQ